MLTDEQIKNFQVIYKKSFGKEISREDAYEKGIKLLNLMSAIYKPMSEEEYQITKKHRRNTLPLLKNRLSNNNSN
ncbi:MAG: hypothetical protein M0P32_03020 [Bacteroidales bacterium]|nr:hypothetical protein [Bacteroidales bacterium]